MSTWYVSYEENDLMHYGVKGRSGRKPGSGKGKTNKPAYKKNGTRTTRFGIGSKQSSGASKIMSILKLKNVSDYYKAMAIKRLYNSGIEIDNNELKKYLKGNPKMLYLFNRLKGSNVDQLRRMMNKSRKITYKVSNKNPKVNSAADYKKYKSSEGKTKTITLSPNNKPRINSATDYKRYRASQLLKKRDALLGKK